MATAISGAMTRRHPHANALPRQWLMTDERLGDDLWRALDALPRGAGVVFRHYATPKAQRAAIFRRIQRIAARRGLILVVAGPLPHGASPNIPRHGGQRATLTSPAHDRRQAIAAIRAGAQALFVSPVYPTRSHPGAPSLGPVRFGLMTRGLRVPVIALGGMNARRFNALKPLGAYGWAAIDAWTQG